MTVFDNARELDENLPAFLCQQYDPGFEVIVVDESSTDGTDDVLKRLKQEHTCLYSTFLPKPNRQVTRRKLALTIGVKAAKYEWVIFTDIYAVPPSQEWLQAISEATESDTEMLLGYFAGEDTRLQTFTDIDEAQKLVEKAERLKADGHKGKRLRFQRGKYDFIAVRKERAHDLLKFFEQTIGFGTLLGHRLSIFLQNLH